MTETLDNKIMYGIGYKVDLKWNMMHTPSEDGRLGMFLWETVEQVKRDMNANEDIPNDCKIVAIKFNDDGYYHVYGEVTDTGMIQ